MQNARFKLRRDVERYRLLQRNISNPGLAALLQEMIAEAEAQLATLDAQWRREPYSAQLLRIGDWRLDFQSKSATLPTGQQVRLTRGEFELLFALLTHSGEVLSREDLMMLSQSRPTSPGERTIDVLINRLRRKVELDPRHPTNIKTIRSAGYLFELQSTDT